MNTSYKYPDKISLVEKVLFLNGLTRAGKFILGKLVSCIDSVEQFQYESTLETIPTLLKTQSIDRGALKALLRIIVDEKSYDMALGRNLNLRSFDASSVSNNPNLNHYLERSKTEDIDSLIENFKTQSRYPCYIIHDSLPLIDIYLESFPKAKIINLLRHPVDLAHSWFKRGWGSRFHTDPLSFYPIAEVDSIQLPWFALSWAHEYKSSTDADRVIKSIHFIVKNGETTFNKLSNESKNRICHVTYENLVENPVEAVKKISNFLDKPVNDSVETVIKRENLPIVISLSSRKKKFEELCSSASPEAQQLLIQLAKNYESNISV